MKEITRRLYTKPVMLGMAFLVGMAVVVGLFVTAGSRAATPFTTVLAGNDEFATDADGQTFHNFAASPIPADFFGPGSQQFTGSVILEGVPLGSGSDTDTIIQRHSNVTVPGSTAITMTALSLKGSNSITVNYSPSGSETWDVIKVNLSQFKASTGTMTFNASTFDSTLKVWPRFTFKRQSDGVEKVFDTGGGSGLTASQTSEFAIGTEADAIAEPAPTVQPAPCRAIKIDDFEGHFNEATAVAASSSCPPVTLTATAPWTPGCGGICFPQPIPEQELLARHRARQRTFVVR